MLPLSIHNCCLRHSRGGKSQPLGFTSPVEQLALRAVPAENLLTWLTTPTVYKAPYIKTASFSKAFFHLKSASEAEADKRITDSCLMFVRISEASKVIPLPYMQPLFLDVPTASDVKDSKKPRSPRAFRAFRLHRVVYAEGSTLRTHVAYPRLGGETKSHLLNFQKQQLIPELREHSMVSAALAEADDRHWNITNDPIYPPCLEGFRRRHESSQASQASLLRGQAQGGEVPHM